MKKRFAAIFAGTVMLCSSLPFTDVSAQIWSLTGSEKAADYPEPKPTFMQI